MLNASSCIGGLLFLLGAVFVAIHTVNLIIAPQFFFKVNTASLGLFGYVIGALSRDRWICPGYDWYCG